MVHVCCVRVLPLLFLKRCSDLEAFVHSEGTDDKLLQQLEDRDDGGVDIEEDWDPDNNGEGVVLGGQAQEDARDSSKSEWSASIMRSRRAIVNGRNNYELNLTDSADFGEGNFDGTTSAQDRMQATTGSKRGADDGAGETHYEGGTAAHFARIEVKARIIKEFFAWP